jgi:hypothetical protein
MKLFVYYRISDKGRPKEKLPNGDRFSCMKNAVKEFGAENIHVIADNCGEETLQFIHSFTEQGITMEETSLGNSGSFLYMIEKIIKIHKADDLVYLLEDDYLHLPNAKKVILEGLAIADYVTLYDHPDKYRLDGNGGNPFNYRKLQKTRLHLTDSTHWRECNSTTMTFSCKVQTLIDDYKVWKKYTKYVTPQDFNAFCEITQNGISDMFSFLFRLKKKSFFILFRNRLTGKKMKKIISAVPAYATHTELLFLSPVIDWNKIF